MAAPQIHIASRLVFHTSLPRLLLSPPHPSPLRGWWCGREISSPPHRSTPHLFECGSSSTTAHTTKDDTMTDSDLRAEMAATSETLVAIELLYRDRPRRAATIDAYCKLFNSGRYALSCTREALEYGDPAAPAIKRMKSWRKKAERFLDVLRDDRA